MTKTTPPSRSADQFVVRLPEGLRDQIAAAAKKNNRSMNAEIVGMITAMLDSGTPSLAEAPSGALFDEFIARYGARVQIVIAQDVAEQAGIAPAKPKRKSK